MPKPIHKLIERKTDNAKALLRYPYIRWKLKADYRLFFFFPFWQIGGGERVHADILKVFRSERSLCFITDQSENDGFKKEFQSYADTLTLGRWAKKPSFKKLMLKHIADAINRQQEAVAFGCHSHFFYELIPFLAKHVKVVDLIHAFTFDPNGPEHYSLPHVPRLDQRVILGEKTKRDFRQLYQEKGLDRQYLERFTIIPNQSHIPADPPAKDYLGRLTVLFVSRNAPEKRPEVFIEIARRCAAQQLPTEFIMVGDFKHWEKEQIPHLNFAGEIFDQDALTALYRSAHIILVTSWREGFPLVMMEGMGNGVVPIATAVGEIPAYISSEGKRNGFLIENEQNIHAVIDNFVECVALLCEQRHQLKEFSLQAYQYAKDNFGPERFGEFYRRLLLGVNITK